MLLRASRQCVKPARREDVACAVVTISRFDVGEQGIIMAWAGKDKGTGKARSIIMASLWWWSEKNSKHER
jgi:hypothetical protein